MSKEFRGMLYILEEFLEKYPEVDDEYLIDIMCECYNGGFEHGKDYKEEKDEKETKT